MSERSKNLETNKKERKYRKNVCEDCVEKSKLYEYLKDRKILDTNYAIRKERMWLTAIFILIDLEIDTEFGRLKAWAMNINDNDKFRFYIFGETSFMYYKLYTNVKNKSTFDNRLKAMKNLIIRNKLNKFRSYKYKRLQLYTMYHVLDYAFSLLKPRDFKWAIREALKYLIEKSEYNWLEFFNILHIFMMQTFRMFEKNCRYAFMKYSAFIDKLPDPMFYKDQYDLPKYRIILKKEEKNLRKITLEEFKEEMKYVANDIIEELISKKGGNLKRTREENIKTLYWYITTSRKSKPL